MREALKRRLERWEARDRDKLFSQARMTLRRHPGAGRSTSSRDSNFRTVGGLDGRLADRCQLGDAVRVWDRCPGGSVAGDAGCRDRGGLRSWLALVALLEIKVAGWAVSQQPGTSLSDDVRRAEKREAPLGEGIVQMHTLDTRMYSTHSEGFRFIEKWQVEVLHSVLHNQVRSGPVAVDLQLTCRPVFPGHRAVNQTMLAPPDLA